MRYEKIRDRNEALDLRKYFLAAVDILRPNLTAIAKKLRAPTTPNNAEGAKRDTAKPGGNTQQPTSNSQQPMEKAKPGRKKISAGGDGGGWSAGGGGWSFK